MSGGPPAGALQPSAYTFRDPVKCQAPEEGIVCDIPMQSWLQSLHLLPSSAIGTLVLKVSLRKKKPTS